MDLVYLLLITLFAGATAGFLWVCSPERRKS